MELDLHKLLALRGQISATSSDAALDHEEGCGKIGAGACGTIFGVDGESIVFKLAEADQESLWNDFQMHQLVAEKFCKWKSRNCVLVSERIQPLPKPTRTLLIEQYCPPQVKQMALNAAANKDCLVRVYLGSLKGREGRFFSLRNFKMHLDQMVELQLDIKELAGKMATDMAIMHWAAKTDARDIEFILGSSPLKAVAEMSAEDYLNLLGLVYTGPLSRIHEDFFVRTTDLWPLDFNQVRQITMDEAGVPMAVEAIRLNDSYIPKPLQRSKVEKQIWDEFVEQYLVAHAILREEPNYAEVSGLPAMFISGVIGLEKIRQEKKWDCSSEDEE
ncbi:hypothetical protein MKX08_010361 [Trichoderma sp. CBMAI-0020]|nr:hypothetical protein MKX08_010361 [Trichoderma sp. CBMAI-0020]